MKKYEIIYLEYREYPYSVVTDEKSISFKDPKEIDDFLKENHIEIAFAVKHDRYGVKSGFEQSANETTFFSFAAAVKELNQLKEYSETTNEYEYDDRYPYSAVILSANGKNLIEYFHLIDEEQYVGFNHVIYEEELMPLDQNDPNGEEFLNLFPRVYSCLCNKTSECRRIVDKYSCEFDDRLNNDDINFIYKLRKITQLIREPLSSDRECAAFAIVYRLLK